MAAEAQARLRAFWEGGRLRELAEALVRRFLPLTVRRPPSQQSTKAGVTM